MCKNILESDSGTDDNTEHAHCKLNNHGYKHALNVGNTVYSRI